MPAVTRPKIIVLDDDPTGSQTVHSCLLLSRWDVDTLCRGLTDPVPIFFILTNTRALPAEIAAEVTRTVCCHLKAAIAQTGTTDYMVVSRSDSTLRGHYPLETDVIAAELGPFDAHFLVPAFLEGGRITRDSQHYLLVAGQPVPVHETEFARDSVFGYHHSYLPDYVAEKTQGRIPAAAVERFVLADVRNPETLRSRLTQLQGNVCGVVDAESQEDLDQFAAAVLEVASEGKRFLFRSAASLLTALAQLPPQPTPPEAMATYCRPGRYGVVLVGSHVRKTTEQLTALLAEPDVFPIEVPVARLRDSGAAEPDIINEVLAAVDQAIASEKTPVIFTSREELTFADAATRLAFGQRVSEVLMAIVQQLPADLRYLISKGGITSNDVLSKGLNLATVRLLGQVIPGCSVVRTGADHPRFPELPVVLFPGNVGDRAALCTVYHRFQGNGTAV
ncbi:four-carbon acid sugar kinase family protein [Thermosynechococcus sp. B0]|uniref:four-carbon acid sugar kinase family protein n=1 Tax=Thermosynechococcus sp. B0 TaxID=2937284 RepID=UPI002575F389|nr:four-carbon acid sugar kinase family protein [Thermosynechococcus sp. B0]WJI23455.1 four-carbon acid sugar kinase family protein [Thermosynechococcus sp. B0]